MVPADAGLAGGHHPLFDEIRMGSAKHLGEDPDGVWTLRVKDLSADYDGTLDSWSITVYGHRLTPGPPTVDSVTPGQDSLAVAWIAHTLSRGSAISAYDLRYIPTDDDETHDADWVVLENVWTGGGNLEYTVSGLRWGIEYDVQLRAVNADGDGLWSETSTGTPIPSECAAPGALTDRDSNPDLTADCDAMLLMQHALDPTDTLNWSPSLSMNAWDGVTLEGTPLRVTRLELPQKGLEGRIAAELGNLTALRVLKLHSNDLQGPIPGELGNLTALEELFLSDNNLDGPVPPELGSLSSLSRLWIQRSGLSGQLPAELGSLSALTELFLENNSLSGHIPSSFGNLTNLEVLALSINRLSGPIPSELGNLSKLRRLYLRENMLTGRIPPQLGNLTGLFSLQLYDNQLSGPIPIEIGNLSDLRDLRLERNRLSGRIPSELGELGNLRHLHLGDNNLSGPIPTEVGQLTNLTSLYFYGNQLVGGIPVQLQSLTSLEDLGLYDNRLTGSIPTELQGLSNLEGLYLHANQLSGSIPVQLGNLTSLVGLNLSNNALTGQIPEELGELSGLKDLSLAQNRLDGTIPTQLGNLSALTSLDLSQNQLNGAIPPELGSLIDVSVLRLNQNALTGAVPYQLSFLGNLIVVDLSFNMLDGEIPLGLDQWTGLSFLGLSQNPLTGCIPQGLRTAATTHDLLFLRLPFCDVLLSALALSEGELTPSFDPEVTSYTAVVAPPQVTIIPTNDHNATFRLFDGNDQEIVDADPEVEGRQVDLAEDVTVIKVVVTALDGQTTHTYSIEVSRHRVPRRSGNNLHDRRLPHPSTSCGPLPTTMVAPRSPPTNCDTSERHPTKRLITTGTPQTRPRAAVQRATPWQGWLPPSTTCRCVRSTGSVRAPGQSPPPGRPATGPAPPEGPSPTLRTILVCWPTARCCWALRTHWGEP